MLAFYSETDFQFTNDIKTNFLGANKLLLSALLLMFAAHIMVMAYWKVDQISEILPHTLHLDLVPAIEKKAKEKINDTKALEPREPIEVEEIIAPPAPISTVPKLSEPREEIQKDDIFEKLSGKELYQDSITSIGKNDRSVTEKYRTFSTSDFPQKADNHDPYAPPSYIPVLVSASRSISVKDTQGYGMIMKDDGFGNVTCSQQRPGAGTEGPMWYRVPASMCGHLR